MKVRKAVRTGIIVLVITATVWVVADRSVLRTSNEMVVDVSVTCTDPNYRVSVLEPASLTLGGVKFTGPGRGIDRVMALMAQEPRLKWEYDLASDEAEKAGRKQQYALPAKEGFANLAEQYRVTLAESDLSQVVIKVEGVERRRVAVDLSAADKEQLTNAYEFEPKDVTAIGPSAELDRLTGGALADVALNTMRLRNGEFDEQTVGLRSSVPGLDVTFDPPKVTVKRIRLSDTFFESKKIEGKIRIWIQATPEVTKMYYVELDPPELSSLTVTAQQSDRLSADDVRAVLELLPNEAPNPAGTPTPRQLKISFPGRDRVRIEESDIPTVNFTLKLKPGEAATPE